MTHSGQISSFSLTLASQSSWCSALSRLSLFNFLPKFILSEHILIVLKNYFRRFASRTGLNSFVLSLKVQVFKSRQVFSECLPALRACLISTHRFKEDWLAQEHAFLQPLLSAWMQTWGKGEQDLTGVRGFAKQIKERENRTDGIFQ